MMTPLICFPGKSEQNEGELPKNIIILAISFSINIIESSISHSRQAQDHK